MEVGPWRLRPGAERLARHWPVLPVLALAALLRSVGVFPNFYYGDEAEYATVASYLAADWRDLAYPRLEGFASTPFVSQPPLVLYLFALATHLTGSIHTGPIVASIVLGTATVGVVYALGCRLRDRWLGCIAALFLAVLPFHVSLSRGAQLDAGLTFFVAVAMLATVAWAQRPSWGNAFAAGTALALAMLAKLPGVLAVVPLAVLLSIHALRAWNVSNLDAGAAVRLREAGAAAGIALTPIALLGTLYLAFLWSLGATTNLLVKLGWQAQRVAGADAATPTRPWDWYFTAPGIGLVPQLGMAIALLAAVGAGLVAMALREPRDRDARLALLVWPAAWLAFFVASGRKEWFDLMPMMPALALLAAWPLQPAARELGARLAKPARWNPAAAVASLCVLVLLATALPVHATVSERILREGRFGAGVREAALWIEAEDPDAGQVGTTLGRFGLHFYNGAPTYHYYVNHTFVAGEIEAGRVRYLVTDPYLAVRYETAWFDHLIEDHDAAVVHRIPTTYGEDVVVYRFGASGDAPAPTAGNGTAPSAEALAGPPAPPASAR